ncbi:DUF7344 domain-containing protein (plasmid) [Haloferacaceae archaeon DSL9]
MSERSPNSAADDVLHVLKSAQRRYILSCLQDTEQLRFSELVEKVATWQHSKPASTLTEDEIRRIKISVHHIHLPKLSDHGLIDRKERNDDLVRLREDGDVRYLVETIRLVENNSPPVDAFSPALDRAGYGSLNSR